MPSMLLDQRSGIQSAIHDRSITSSSPAPHKRVPGTLHLQHPSKRLKVGQHHYTGISTLSSLTKHVSTRENNFASVTPPITSGRPSSMRGDAVRRFKAEKWFDDTNKDASGMSDVPFLDDDPPFYIDKQSSSGLGSVCAVHSDGSPVNLSNFGPSTAPTRSLLARMESSESNSEDFRGVIDDLTIENNKLKRKLKKYEKLHCSHLQDEKLFEVRIHGLAAHRKRELEETLRSFASSMDEDSPSRPLIQSTGLQNLAPVDPPALHKPSSSSTSNSKAIDSAYASMSGQTGLSQTHSQMQNQGRSDRLAHIPHTNQQNVTSYLHDIPETLMPKHSMAMSNRSKSKIVVKRLEQIFTGKGAAPRQHNQSHQQQEVSQSAAQADRTRLEARGRPTIREGLREARILNDDSHLQVDSLSEANLAVQNSRSSFEGEDSTRNTQASRDASPEQRPTRPLDLDLHRAQVPSDNLEYIRHLGLAADADQASEGEGWVYLNLLTSMAQLHTLNVTPEFIRHAIADASAQFELSADGTKVRWSGGVEGTRLSSDSEESEGMAKKSMETSHLASKTGSFADSSEVQELNSALPFLVSEKAAVPETGAKRRPVTLGQHDGVKFHYRPLFFHTAPSEEESADSVSPTEESSSDWRENATGLNSGLNSGSHGLRESEVRLRKQNHGNGPIIFYNKARFCTDLSGDPSGAMFDGSAYRRFTQVPVGLSPANSSEAGDEHTDVSVVDGEELVEVDVASSRTVRSALDLEDLKSSISDCASSPSPMDMEASGLGGIQPEDNFVVKVQVRHGQKVTGRGSSELSPFANPKYQVRHMLHRLRRRSVNVSQEEKQDIPRSQPLPPLKTEIISAVKKNLPPSSLPPPSYNFSPSDDDDDEYENEKNDNSSYEEPYVAPPRQSVDVFIDSRPTDFFIGSSKSSESKGSSYISTSSGSDSDSSIDLLAHARVLDPDTIAAQEREFDNNGSQCLAEPLPASSSAAMANEASGSAGRTRIRVGESDVDSMSVDGIGLSESG